LHISQRLCNFELEIVVANKTPNEAKKRFSNLGLIRTSGFAQVDNKLILKNIGAEVHNPLSPQRALKTFVFNALFLWLFTKHWLWINQKRL